MCISGYITAPNTERAGYSFYDLKDIPNKSQRAFHAPFGSIYPLPAISYMRSAHHRYRSTVLVLVKVFPAPRMQFVRNEVLVDKFHYQKNFLQTNKIQFSNQSFRTLLLTTSLSDNSSEWHRFFLPTPPRV